MTKRNLSPYLEQQILSASPLQLINLSYRTAIQAVREARTFLDQKKIKDRVRSISLAHGVLAELYRSLDFKAGDGEISRDLGRLYDYMMRRLLEANANATDEPLAEVLSLLCSMSDAWEQVAAAAAHQTASARSYSPSPSPSFSSPAWAGCADLTADAGSSRYSLSF